MPPSSLPPWLFLLEVTSEPAPVGPSTDCQPSPLSTVHPRQALFFLALLVLFLLRPCNPSPFLILLGLCTCMTCLWKPSPPIRLLSL